MTSIGIDFGTTNSVVAQHAAGSIEVLPIDGPPLAWANLGFDRVLPSVLGVGTAEEATYGWAAKQQADNKLEAVKRLFATEDIVRIGDFEYSVETAAALLFARLKNGAEETGVMFDRAVVTVPANSRGLARLRTKLCAGLAGIEVVALLNEPTAAAMAHSLSANVDQTILVFDWGGGTLDVTVLETVAGVFIERASKGIQRSGGLDLDNLLGSAVQARIPGHEAWTDRQRAAFKLDIEYAKVLLSTQLEATIETPGPGQSFTITRELLESAIRPKIEETRMPIDQCLRDLGIDASGIDQVVLVGGSSKIPAVRTFVSEILGKEPVAGVDPMTAVAQGAATAAAILAGELDADFFVATEHALGTISLNDVGQPHFSVLIGRNHQLPARAAGGYQPVNPGQKTVLVQVIEGDPDVPLDDPDNVVLKEWEVDVDPDQSPQQNAFTISYEYDVDGILHVNVTNDATGDQMLHEDLSFGVSQDKAALVTVAKSVRETIDGGRLAGGTKAAHSDAVASLDSKSRDSIERVRTKIIPFVDDDEAARLEGMCRDLEHAAGQEVDTCRDALDAEARKYAYLL